MSESGVAVSIHDILFKVCQDNMKGKGGIIGGIITLVIGGTVFTASRADIAKNFQKDTGLSQQEAEQYVSNVTEDDLVPYDKLGSDTISDGQGIKNAATQIDCFNYSYEWETATLTCEEAKSQLNRIGNSEIALGNAYVTLSSDSANEDDMSTVIRLIDKLNIDLRLEIVTLMLDPPTITELKNTNSYNKALLQAALDSN